MDKWMRTERRVFHFERGMCVPLEIVDYVTISENGAMYQINIKDMEEPCYTVTTSARMYISSDNYMVFELHGI